MSTLPPSDSGPEITTADFIVTLISRDFLQNIVFCSFENTERKSRGAVPAVPKHIHGGIGMQLALPDAFGHHLVSCHFLQ